MLILPADYVGENEITHSNFAEDKRLDVKCNATMPVNAAERFGFTDTDVYTYFAGSIVNLNNYNYSRKFAARSYMEVVYADGTSSYFYADYNETDNSRSAYEVAVKAYASASETEKTLYETYINGVAALSATAIDDALSFVRGDESNNTFTLSQNQSVYELTFEQDVYSLMINGTKISKTLGGEILIGENAYTVSGLSINGKTVIFEISKKA